MSSANWVYIISALSHTGLDHKTIFENKDVLNKINDMLGSCQGKHDHGEGLLFNAFTEKNNGPKLRNYTQAAEIHSDSGGLQVVTLGKKVNDEIRRKIYKVQADYSDIAMSFDEMPVAVDERSTKLDISARKFDRANFEEMSKKSGRNLHDQINFFLDEKTKTKPLVILHGNDIDWYQRNLDLILGEIPQDKWKHIAGISCGSGAMGFGDLENVERAAVMAFIDAPEHMKKCYHVLGVGSLGRMMPLISLVRNGVFDKDVKITYDSSSLTIAFTLGFYHFDDYWCKAKLDQQYDETFMKMYEDVATKSKKMWDIDINLEDLHALLCKSKGAANRGDNPEKYILNAAVLFNSVMNFNSIFCKLTHDNETYNTYTSKDAASMNLTSLKMITSKDEFRRWKGEYGRLFKSIRVDSGDNSSLEGFF